MLAALGAGHHCGSVQNACASVCNSVCNSGPALRRITAVET